jgi:hypothetical protein
MIRRGFIQTLLATPVVACLPKPKTPTPPILYGHDPKYELVVNGGFDTDMEMEEWVRRTVEARFDEVFKQYCITGNGVVR